MYNKNNHQQFQTKSTLAISSRININNFKQNQHQQFQAESTSAISSRRVSLCSLIVLLFQFLVLTIRVEGQITCERGKYLHDVVCLPCKNGTFQDKTEHQETECKICTQIYDYSRQVVVKPCSIISDTVIGCEQGYYKTVDHHGGYGRQVTCDRCSVCEGKFLARPCSDTTDATCCDAENMDAVLGTDGQYHCQTFCSRGQYLDEDSGMTCKSCPSETYMPDDHHTNVQCMRCTQYGEDTNVIIVSHCNTTHNTPVTCIPNYFLQFDAETNQFDCRICRLCSSEESNTFTGRACDNITNTVCCAKDNMDVEQTPNGYICKEKITERTEQSDVQTGQYADGALESEVEQILHGETNTNSNLSAWTTHPQVFLLLLPVLFSLTFYYVRYLPRILNISFIILKGVI